MEIAISAPTAHRQVHVTTSPRGWAVSITGDDYYFALAQTQREAIIEGVRLAKEAAATLYIHGRNGRIREVWHYGR